MNGFFAGHLLSLVDMHGKNTVKQHTHGVKGCRMLQAARILFHASGQEQGLSVVPNVSA